jgi:hypothetical protein
VQEIAIVGGTGAYRGAQGTILSRSRGRNKQLLGRHRHLHHVDRRDGRPRRRGRPLRQNGRQVTGSRRLSQAISEGDGISLIVSVADAASARRAEEQGAEAVAVTGPAAEIRAATSLPILQLGDPSGGGDAAVIVAEGRDERLEELQSAVLEAGLECVVDVHDDEELELALERIDPEVFLISPRSRDDDEEPLDRVLDLLPDVPAGKLAIADVPVTTRDEVVALERAGFDAVLVGTAEVAGLSGHSPPAV